LDNPTTGLVIRSGRPIIFLQAVSPAGRRHPVHRWAVGQIAADLPNPNALPKEAKAMLEET
jgi:hypothetical protein